MSSNKVAITCALNGVLTNPLQHPVPVTPAQMAASAGEAYDAGAAIMHIHFRHQGEGLGHLPTWDPDVAAEIVDGIRARCPGVIINMTTGVMDDDISGPVGCLERVRPEMAAMNSGSLNYLKQRSDGRWAWPPMVFLNSVDKITRTLDVMNRLDVRPECECFDTGIVRSVAMYEKNGLLQRPYTVSLVMGVDSGMPANPDWLPLLVAEIPEGVSWQTIVIGRQEVWDVHRRSAALGGNLRTGLEDTFYLPDGERASGNGALIEALVKVARDAGREPMSVHEVRQVYRMAPVA
jgi:uncharacterized protein (DUF849 family)